jgi:hypothetical protein
MGCASKRTSGQRTAPREVMFLQTYRRRLAAVSQIVGRYSVSLKPSFASPDLVLVNCSTKHAAQTLQAVLGSMIVNQFSPICA